MNILIFLLVGLVAGWIAGKLVEGHGFGPLGDIIVGIIGAFVGGYILNIFSVDAYGFWGAVMMSVLGATVFLFVVGLFSGTHRLKYFN